MSLKLGLILLIVRRLIDALKDVNVQAGDIFNIQIEIEVPENETDY